MGAPFVGLISVVLLASPSAGPRLDFELKAVRTNMKPVSRAPWFEPGGGWTVFDCAAGGVDFIIATTERQARFGPAQGEGRAALVALLAKTFSVPVAAAVPGASGFVFNEGSSARELISRGGIGPTDALQPAVYGDDIIGALGRGLEGQRQVALLEFTFSPKKKSGWLRTDDARRLVTEVARGAWKAGPEWTPLGEAGGAFLGFVSDGRAVLSSRGGMATALDLVALDSRKVTPLGRLEGDVHRVQCATPLENGCLTEVGGQLWSLAPQTPPRAIGPRVSASNLRVWLSPSGAWVALHTNTICIPHRCRDELLVRNVATGATVLQRPVQPRGFLEGLGLTWRREGRQEVLVVDSADGLERFAAPAFKPLAARPGGAPARRASPDGRLVLDRRTFTADGGTTTVDVIRDVASGVEQRVEVETEEASWLDSRLLLAPGQPMRVIDASTGKVRVTFTLPPPPHNFVTVDPSLKWLLAEVEDQLLMAPLPAGR